jgi:hypothetical protein
MIHKGRLSKEEEQGRAFKEKAFKEYRSMIVDF